MYIYKIISFPVTIAIPFCWIPYMGMLTNLACDWSTAQRTMHDVFERGVGQRGWASGAAAVSSVAWGTISHGRAAALCLSTPC